MDFDDPGGHPGDARRARRLHRARDQPLEEQDDNVRFFDHRREWARTDFEARRDPPQGVGGAARRDAPPGRRGRVAAPGPARGVRRPGRLEPGDGDHPRAPGHQGPRSAQRPAERELHRRELPDGADDARLRHRRAEGGVDARVPRRHAAAWPSASPSRTTASDATYMETTAVARRRRVGAQRARSASTRACTTPPTTSSSPGPPASPGRRSGSPRSSSRPTRPASRSSSSGGPSTCRPTTPRSP